MYCVKERKNTEDINPVITTAKNGRKMLKAQCASCGIMKTQFVKSGGNIDIHKAILPALPKKGLTLPGYKYCGPGNPSDGETPSNNLYAACMEHDYCYESGMKKSKCDKQMLTNLKKSK